MRGKLDERLATLTTMGDGLDLTVGAIGGYLRLEE